MYILLDVKDALNSIIWVPLWILSHLLIITNEELVLITFDGFI